MRLQKRAMSALALIVLLICTLTLTGCASGSSSTKKTSKKQPTATPIRIPTSAFRVTPTPLPTRPTATLVNPPETPQTATPKPQGTPLKGDALLNGRCAACHTLDRVKMAKKSEAEWRATVEQMVGKGVLLSATEEETLVKYLAGRYK
jgi:mono/diheme cytochrome c family protein